MTTEKRQIEPVRQPFDHFTGLARKQDPQAAAGSRPWPFSECPARTDQRCLRSPQPAESAFPPRGSDPLTKRWTRKVQRLLRPPEPRPRHRLRPRQPRKPQAPAPTISIGTSRSKPVAGSGRIDMAQSCPPASLPLAPCEHLICAQPVIQAVEIEHPLGKGAVAARTLQTGVVILGGAGEGAHDSRRGRSRWKSPSLRGQRRSGSASLRLRPCWPRAARDL